MSNTSSLAIAFVERAGIPEECSSQCIEIENLFRNRLFVQARKSLRKLYFLLANSVQDGGQVKPKDVPAFVFWNGKANQLIMAAPVQGFRLAFECLDFIEEQNIQSESARVGVYSAAIASSREVISLLPGYRNVVCSALKNAMMRVSEFTDCTVTDGIFDVAAQEFQRVLLLYSPTERYEQISNLSEWVKSREVESPYLREFVQEMMALSKEYENGIRYIPDMEEELEAPRSSHLKLVYSNQPS